MQGADPFIQNCHGETALHCAARQGKLKALGLNMYVCMYVCIRVCMCINVYRFVRVFVWQGTLKALSLNMFVCMYVCIYTCMYVCVYMYIGLFVFLYGKENSKH